MKLVKDTDTKALKANKVSDQEAEEAFKTILTWIGEDPSREGLLETPKRVIKAYKEYFGGYTQDAEQILSKTFGDVEGYDDMVVEKNISVTRLTMQVAKALMTSLDAKGVAVTIDAAHQCMTMRGIKKESATTVTNYFLGQFKEDLSIQNRYLRFISK